jgi:hypothetical protein
MSIPASEPELAIHPVFKAQPKGIAHEELNRRFGLLEFDGSVETMTPVT